MFLVGANRSGFLPFQSIFCCLRSQERVSAPETRRNFPKWRILADICHSGDVQLSSTVDDSACSFPCSGDKSESCGAAGVQDLYIDHLHIPRVPAKLSVPYLGCFADDGPSRVLPYHLLGSDDMTAAKCAAHCFIYDFFGLEYGRECWCGNLPPSNPVPESECSYSCAGDKGTLCGAGQRLNVWGIRLTAPPTVGPYTYQGCYTDNNNGRALAGAVYRDPNMTPASCAASCTGYAWFGLEYSTQCFCGTDLLPSSKKVAGMQCDMPCGGDLDAPCGDADRLNVYYNPTAAPVSNPAAVGEFKQKGCWTDSQSARSLYSAVLRRDDMTIGRCASFCKAFNYFGVEFGSQCYCGNSLGGAHVSESQCGELCVGDSTETCGAADRLTVYGIDVKQPLAQDLVGEDLFANDSTAESGVESGFESGSELGFDTEHDSDEESGDGDVVAVVEEAGDGEMDVVEEIAVDA